MFKYFFSCVCCIILWLPQRSAAQQDTMAANGHLSLEQCIRYALNNQPALKQSLIDASIQQTNINISLSAWLPQATLNASLQHYFELPTNVITNFSNPSAGKIAVQSGVYNTSTPQFNATETFFSNDVLYAANTAKYYRRQAQQNIAATRIDLVVDVSKAFYDVLLTQEQINILNGDIARLEKNLKDAYSQYQAGIVDKVDYKRATIALSNARTQLKTATENVQAKYTYLRQLMGYRQQAAFTLDFDTARMMQEIVADTNSVLQYDNRIEYQQLVTSKKLQGQATKYYQFGFLPSLSGYYTYNAVYQNDKFSDLYSKQYPNSLVGLNLSLPLFQGFRRIQNIRKSKLQEERMDLDMVDLTLRINSEYSAAMAGYKSNLTDLQATEENRRIAKEVYDVVKLQYREGIKNYLEVITAETDLRTAELNYLNALFRVLSGKLDLERAMGNVSVNY